jgi:hypothetical protein
MHVVGHSVPNLLMTGFFILPITNIILARCANTANSVGQCLAYFPYFDKMKGVLLYHPPISLCSVCPSVCVSPPQIISFSM